MAFEDLITGLVGEDTPAPIDPELLASRTERKGLTDFSARARQPVDFGADDEVIGPAPKPRRAKAAPAGDFGADDEVVDAMYGQTVPTPKARPAEADALTSPVPLPRPRPPAEIQPTQAMPEVQPLEDAPFRAPSSGLTTNMLTGEEAYAEREANIKAAEDTVAEARTRLQAAQERQNAVLAPSTRRGTTGNVQRQAIDAEVENARKNLSEAELGLSAAQRANPPTQKPIRDAASRFATAVGTIVPDTVGGIARPIDAALDAAGIENGTGIAEAMREASRRIGIANQPDPTREEDLTAKLGQGAGSAVGFVATGVVGKAAGLPAWAASGVTGAAQNAEQYYREADDMGAPAYKKALAYISGGAIGSTEAVGLGRIADEMDKATGGGVRRYFGLIAKEMGEEGLQEGVQQLLDNIAKYALYGKDPGDITKDVATNALIGAMLGMGMAGTMGAPTFLQGRRGEANIPVPPQAPVSAEDIAAQILGESSAPPAQAPAAPQPTPTSPAPAAETPADNSALPSNQTENINTPPSPEQAKAVGDADRAMLRAYGYSDENIDDMSPGQIAAEVAAAEDAGTKPEFGTDDHVVGTRAAPVNIETADDLKEVTNAASGEYTPSQGEANNRPLGHAKWNGLDISIETEAGGIRRGQDPKTKQTWETRMGAAYGYIKGTVGADGMHVDVFMGNKPESDRVYVIDEVDSETGKFRQHKVMAGFPTEQAARAAYLRTSSKSEKTFGAIADISIDELKAWLREGDLKAPAVKTRAITLPKQTTKSSEPTSLLQFIASKGGLAPDPELTALDLTGSHRVNIPGRTGRFGVVRPTGMSLDQMREAAEEAGYFRGAGNATSTVRDFLDAIDNELRGQRKLPEGQEAEPSKRELQRLEEENAHRAAIEADNRAEIEQMLRDVGIPEGITNEEDIALAARIMADEDMSAEDALELAAMRNLETDLPVTQDQIDDIYDFGAFDAVQPRATQEDEPASASEGAGDERSGEEGRTDEPVDDLPRPVEDRQEASEESPAGEPGQAADRAEEAGSEGRAADQGVEVSSPVAGLSPVDTYNAIHAEADRRYAPTSSKPDKKGKVEKYVSHEHIAFTNGAQGYDWDMAMPIHVKREDVINDYLAGVRWKNGFPDDPAAMDAKPATEQTEAGEQTVLPGAEKIGMGEQAQRKANERLKPIKPQKPADEGLFGDEKDQTDLLDIKPPAQPAKTETTEARESGPSDSEDLDFDSIIDEAIDKYAPEPKASAAAKSAAKILDQRTKDAESGRLTEEPRFSIRRRSSSLTGAEIDAPGLLQALQLPHGRFWVDYTRLAKKHPEAFSSPAQVRDHVESVLSAPDVAIPQRSGNIDLVKRSDVDRLIGFRTHLKSGRYQIATAYVLDPGQFERMKSGAAHAGATVLELSSKDHLSGQGRNDEYNRLDAGGQSAPPPMSPQVRANLEQALTDVVRKIVGPSIEVRFPDVIPLKAPPKGWGSFKPDAETAAGSYLPADALMKVALADPNYPLEQVLDTTFHEAFHALEDRLLTDQEMEVLKREDARLRQIVQQAFGFSNEEIKTIAGFEIRAMAFEYYASMRARGLHAPGVHIGIRKAFERLMEIFRRVGNYLRGLGYQNADDILRAAYDGAYSGRAGGRTAGAEQANIRGQVLPQGNLNRFDSYDPLPERWQDWWKRPDLNWRDRVWGMIDAAFLKANRALGDRYVDMRRMQAAVELAGRRVTEGIDMALAATLFEGRTEKRLKDYWLKTWRPVLAEIADMGVSREELHEYLYARHAPERNRHIADINPLMPDGGSGMTNDEAQAVMDRFEADGKRELMERAAQKVDAIVRRIRATMVADQLEHEETIRGWEQAYQYYVPLQGFESGDEDMANPIRRGTGFDVRGPETKAALGRSSKADDILSNLFLMGERTIIRGEQNRVGRTAMRFMQSNPQPSLYDVQRTERILTDGRIETMMENDIDLLMGERAIAVQRRNPHTGLVESVTRVASAFAKDSFAVKVGGHTYYIRIKHPDLLTALKNVGVERLPALIRAHGWLTRQFAAFRTARNPDFFVANLFRDIQDAALTVTAEQRAEFLKHFAANIGTLRSYVGAVMGEMMEADNVAGDFARRRFVEKRWAQLHQDWKKNGGQIAFMGIHDLDQAKREIESAFNETKESYLKSVAMFPGRTAKNLLKAIEFFNGMIEAGTRLAVYDAAVKAGMTKAQAAQLSKEATTNFNRRGIYSPFLGSFYAFFNARVQGGLKTIRLLRTSKMARRAAIGLAVGGFATTLWNLAVSPDDEDKKPEYMKRKYWERERYFIFYMPGSKEPFRIPMGYGLQLFWMLGENLAMVSQGKITPGAAAANYLSTIAGAFSPLTAEGSAMDPATWLRLIMPSIEMPLYELSANENWRRKPIHPKFGAKGEPHSEQPFTTTSPFAIDVARFLNRATGGDAFRPGKVDLYPGDIQYVWEFAGGGLGQTVNRTATMMSNWADGVPTPANQIPIVRHFVGANVEQSTGESYYEDREKVQKGMAQVRKAMKADINGPQGDAAADTIEKGGNEFGVKQGKRKGTVSSDAETIFRAADKELKDLRQQERAARADKTMDSAAREILIKDIRENMRQVQEEARKAYREIKTREPAF